MGILLTLRKGNLSVNYPLNARELKKGKAICKVLYYLTIDVVGNDLI